MSFFNLSFFRVVLVVFDFSRCYANLSRMFFGFYTNEIYFSK